MFFIILIIGILFMASFSNIKMNGQKKQLLWIVFTLGSIMLCFRGISVGIDTKNYYYIIEHIFNLNSWSYSDYAVVEPLFFYIVKLLGCIINSPLFVFTVIGIITMVAFGLFIYRYSTDVVLSSLMFFSSMFFFAFNGMRQDFAIAFLLFAIMTALNDKKIISLCLFGIAGFIHYSILIFIPFFLVLFVFKDNTRKKTIVLSIASVAGVVIMSFLIELVITYIPAYARYFEYEDSKNISSSQLTITAIALCAFTIFLIMLYLIKQEKIKEQLTIQNEGKAINFDFGFMNSMSVLVIGFYVIWFVGSQMFILLRCQPLFGYANIIAMPYLLSVPFYKSKNKNGYYILRFLFVLYYTSLAVNFVISNPHEIFPYKFFWE